MKRNTVAWDVLKYLACNPEGLSARHLWEIMTRNRSPASLATVSVTLANLVQRGMVHRSLEKKACEHCGATRVIYAASFKGVQEINASA